MEGLALVTLKLDCPASRSGGLRENSRLNCEGCGYEVALQNEQLRAAINDSIDTDRQQIAVLNRALKEKTTVPLFFAQTLISSLRDVGYNHTTSALCEHIDNAIEAGATEIRQTARSRGSARKLQSRISRHSDSLL